jgi:hypothetical protein
MTWNELDDRLEELQRQFPAPLATLQTWRKPGSVFAVLESQTSEALDAAIREFARTQAWPELTPNERAMMGFRLDFARQILGALGEVDTPAALFPTHEWSEPAQWEWALVTAWFHPGAMWWEHLAHAMRGNAAADPPSSPSTGN